MPLLPLTNHFTEYYVTVPAIGLAILGGWALAEARGPMLPVAATVAVLYLIVSIADNRVAERFHYDRARNMKHLITALQALPPDEAHKKIILAGIDNGFFWTGFHDDPFRLIGMQVVSGARFGSVCRSASGMGRHREVRDPQSGRRARHASHQAAIYQLVDRKLRDITPQYLASVPANFGNETPDLIDVGDTAYASYLGPTWYPPEQGFRWMPKTATVKIAGPQHSGGMLEINGFCPDVLLSQGAADCLVPRGRKSTRNFHVAQTRLVLPAVSGAAGDQRQTNRGDHHRSRPHHPTRRRHAPARPGLRNV